MSYYITFSSTSYAINGEKICKLNNINYKIRPLPSKLGAGCGICIVIKNNDVLDKLLNIDKFMYQNVYLANDDYIKIR